MPETLPQIDVPGYRPGTVDISNYNDLRRAPGIPRGGAPVPKRPPPKPPSSPALAPPTTPLDSLPEISVTGTRIVGRAFLASALELLPRIFPWGLLFKTMRTKPHAGELLDPNQPKYLQPQPSAPPRPPKPPVEMETPPDEIQPPNWWDIANKPRPEWDVWNLPSSPTPMFEPEIPELAPIVVPGFPDVLIGPVGSPSTIARPDLFPEVHAPRSNPGPSTSRPAPGIQPDPFTASPFGQPWRPGRATRPVRPTIPRTGTGRPPAQSPARFADPVGFASPESNGCSCDTHKTKDKKPRKARSKCTRGTYIQRGKGTIFHANETVACDGPIPKAVPVRKRVADALRKEKERERFRKIDEKIKKAGERFKRQAERAEQRDKLREVREKYQAQIKKLKGQKTSTRSTKPRRAQTRKPSVQLPF